MTEEQKARRKALQRVGRSRWTRTKWRQIMGGKDYPKHYYRTRFVRTGGVKRLVRAFQRWY